MTRFQRASRARFLMLLVPCLAAFGCDEPPGECRVGAAECPCSPVGECDDGLLCAVGVCQPYREVVLRVSEPSARACEVLLIDGQARVAAVRFQGTTLGTDVREAPRTAVTFTSTVDAAIGSDAVRLQLVGDGDPVRVGRSTCFDGAGQPLSSASVTVEG